MRLSSHTRITAYSRPNHGLHVRRRVNTGSPSIPLATTTTFSTRGGGIFSSSSSSRRAAGNASSTSSLKCARRAPAYEQAACRPRLTHARHGDRESHRILAALQEVQATMERRRSWGLTLGRGIMDNAWRRLIWVFSNGNDDDGLVRARLRTWVLNRIKNWHAAHGDRSRIKEDE